LSAANGQAHALSHSLILKTKHRILWIGVCWLWAGRPSGDPGVLLRRCTLGKKQKTTDKSTIPRCVHTSEPLHFVYFIAEKSVGRIYTSSTLYSSLAFSIKGSADLR